MARAAPLPRIKLDGPTRQTLSRLLTSHLADELSLDVGEFESLELLDWIAETIGPYIYNQGLYDAQAVLRKRIDGITEAIAEIEKPTKHR